MFRIGTALCLALSLGSAAAQAAVPEASAEAMLDRTVQSKLTTYRAMLTAMQRDAGSWSRDEAFSDQVDAARDLLTKARTQHQAGNDEAALKGLNKAWQQMAPAAKVWAGHAADAQKQAVVRAVLGATSERIAMMESYRADLSTESLSALDRAQAAHTEARTLRAEDPRAAIGKQREAMKALDVAFSTMWTEYQAGES